MINADIVGYEYQPFRGQSLEARQSLIDQILLSQDPDEEINSLSPGFCMVELSDGSLERRNASAESYFIVRKQGLLVIKLVADTKDDELLMYRIGSTVPKVIST